MLTQGTAKAWRLQCSPRATATSRHAMLVRMSCSKTGNDIKAQDGFRRRDRDPRRDARRWSVGQILGPARSHAESESGNGYAGCTDCRQERESRPGSVSHRQGRHRAVHDRPRVIHIEALEENFKALLDAVSKARPSSANGVFLKKVSVSSTMGVGVRVDHGA